MLGSSSSRKVERQRGKSRQQVNCATIGTSIQVLVRAPTKSSTQMFVCCFQRPHKLVVVVCFLASNKERLGCERRRDSLFRDNFECASSRRMNEVRWSEVKWSEKKWRNEQRWKTNFSTFVSSSFSFSIFFLAYLLGSSVCSSVAHVAALC